MVHQDQPGGVNAYREKRNENEREGAADAEEP